MSEADNLSKLLASGAELVGGTPEVARDFSGAGSLTSPLVIETFKEAGTAVVNHSDAERELRQAGGAMLSALHKIQIRLKQGEPLRRDDFFEAQAGGRRVSTELLEALLRAAQKELDEKKVRFYGRLYANIAFDPGANRAEADNLISLLEKLSYRQLGIIGAGPQAVFEAVQGSISADLLSELDDLIELGLIRRREKNRLGWHSHTLDKAGERVYELLGLEAVPDETWQGLFRQQ